MPGTSFNELIPCAILWRRRTPAFIAVALFLADAVAVRLLLQPAQAAAAADALEAAAGEPPPPTPANADADAPPTADAPPPRCKRSGARAGGALALLLSSRELATSAALQLAFKGVARANASMRALVLLERFQLGVRPRASSALKEARARAPEAALAYPLRPSHRPHIMLKRSL